MQKMLTKISILTFSLCLFHGEIFSRDTSLLELHKEYFRTVNKAIRRAFHQISPHKKTLESTYARSTKISNTEEWRLEAEFNRKGDVVVTSCIDGGPTLLWDVKTGKILFSLLEDAPAEAHFNHDGTQVVVASGGAAKIFDVYTGKLIQILQDEHHIYSASFNQKGTLVLTLQGETAAAWDVATGSKISTVSGTGDDPYVVRFNPEGTQVVFGYCDGVAELYDVTTGTLIQTFNGKDWATFALLNQAGTLLFIGGYQATVWDVKTGNKVRVLVDDPKVKFIDSINFNHDETQIAVTCSDSSIRIFDVATGKLITFLYDNDRSLFVEFNKMGNQLLVEHDSPGVGVLWNLSSGSIAHLLDCQCDEILSGHFNREGTLLVLGCNNSTAKIFDVTSGELVYTLNANVAGRTTSK